MTKIWAVEMMSESYRTYDSRARIIYGSMAVFEKYWLVKCPCQKKMQAYQTLAIHPDLDHCPECKAAGELSEEPWFGKEGEEDGKL